MGKKKDNNDFVNVAQPDGMEGTGKKRSKKRKAILFSVLGVLLVGIITGVVLIEQILTDPLSQFDTIKEQMTVVPGEEATPTPEPLLTIDENVAGASENKANDEQTLEDLDMIKDGIINVMLIGVDYSDERLTEEWIDGGKGKTDFHADVMMVIAINTIENRVDMISMPRDTWAEIPGVEGIYKMNASLDCGGGYPEGLYKVCETAEWMLGGDIPIDYYYAVTMPVVKELVDATVGLVEYDVEMDFTMGEREYEAGVQMLNGQGVLDYMRVRKDIPESGDQNRVDRQKEMLIAIFETMKQKDLLSQLPAIVESFNGKMETNTTLAQTAALASFAYSLPTDNIYMHTMGGSYTKMFDQFNYTFTDQENRVEIIEEVYGLTVPENEEYTYAAASSMWMAHTGGSYISKAQGVLNGIYNMSPSQRSTLSSLIRAAQSGSASDVYAMQEYADDIADAYGYSVSWGGGMLADNEVEVDFR